MKNLFQLYIIFVLISLSSNLAEAQKQTGLINISPEIHRIGNPAGSYDENSPEKKLNEQLLRNSGINNLQNEVNSKYNLIKSSHEIKYSEPVVYKSDRVNAPDNLTNISLIDTSDIFTFNTVSEQLGNNPGRIWTVFCPGINNMNTFKIYYSDDNGINWRHFADYFWMWSAAYQIIAYTELDLELITNAATGNKMLYLTFDTYENIGTRIGVMKIDITSEAVNASQFVFNWGNQNYYHDYRRPKIATNNSFQPYNPYVFICASHIYYDYSTSDYVNEIVYAQDQSPLTLTTDLYYTHSPVGVPRHSNSYIGFDFCWFARNSVEYLMFVEEGSVFANSTYFVGSQCTIWEAFSGGNLSWAILGNTNKQIAFPSIASDGFNVMIAAEYTYSGSDHDIVYLKSSSGISGFLSIGFLDNSILYEIRPKLSSSWNSAGTFYCGYRKISWDGHLYYAMHSSSSNTIWNSPNTMVSQSIYQSIFTVLPAKAKNNECFVLFNSDYWTVRLYSSQGCSGNFNYTKHLDIKLLIEGFYRQSENKMIAIDTIRIYLRNKNSPYNFIDSSKTILEKSGTASVNFINASDNVNYFLIVRHRNSIETWCSQTGIIFTDNKASYDFTINAAQTYGSNAKRIDNEPVKYGMHSGDVNQDGLVDISDNQLVDNDTYHFVSGYVKTDLNGDNDVDITDAAIGDNNAFNYVSTVRP